MDGLKIKEERGEGEGGLGEGLEGISRGEQGGGNGEKCGVKMTEYDWMVSDVTDSDSDCMEKVDLVRKKTGLKRQVNRRELLKKKNTK